MTDFILGILFGIALIIFASALFIQWLKWGIEKEYSNSKRRF
jgi:hypothetical protein